MGHRTTGFVYVLTNESMPGLVKVGFTAKMPEDRALQLYTSGVPTPFEIHHRCVAMQPRTVEHLAHEILGSHRVTGRREFFRCTADLAVEAVDRANRQLNGVLGHSETLLTRIRRKDRVALPTQPGQTFLLLRHRNPFLSSSAVPEIVDIFQVHSPLSQLELYGIDAAEQIPGLSDPGMNLLRDPVPYLDREQRAINGTLVAIERLLPGDQLLWISDGELVSSHLFEFDDWCQLVGRTWDPRLLEFSIPPLWNFLNQDPHPRILHHAQQRISKLPMPRTWADDAMRASSNAPQKILSEAEWLRQLHQ